MQAARAAAAIRRELGLEVELADGHYGEFTVLVDGQEIMSGGKLAFLGVLPSVQSVREVIERAMRPDTI